VNFFHPRNWSRYSRKFSGDKEGLRKYKRVILVSQFALVGGIIGVLHSLEDLVDGLLFMPMMDLLMGVSIFACYLLNESGRHKLARIGLVGFLNIFFFVYSSLANHELGIYLYYFAWVGLAAVVFDDEENLLRFFFIGLSIVLTIVLLVTHFDIFGSVTFEARDIERSFIINLVSSMAVLVFFIMFMVNLNEQSEKKLVDLATEVETKNEELEKTNRELDRFFYSTSHDLKVPVMDIKGILNMAMAEPQDEKVMQYLALLRDRADKLDSFLKDVIDYARNAQTMPASELVNLSVMVDEVLANFTFVSGADKINFERKIDVDRFIEVDRIRLMIVLNNVVSNAIKYHRHEIRNPFVRIAAHIESDHLIISISDNGQGIDADLLPRIFDMFFRGTNQSKGSGLGLYIVKETLQKIGGTIEAYSNKQAGTTFTMKIPVTVKQKIPVSVLAGVTIL